MVDTTDSSSESPPRMVAALTIVRDEPFFLPLWHRHYSQAFAPEDLWCLNHVASAEEPADPEFSAALALFREDRVERVVQELFDPAWLRQVVTDRVRALLAAGYCAVLFAEVDELLVPASGTLAAYVASFAAGGRAAVRCVGWEIHHDMTSEPPIDLRRPVLEQRGWWHRNIKYDKALLLTAPLTWSLGFHECAEDVPLDENWLLVHLHKYDFQAFLARHEARCKYKHSPEAIKMQWNLHYRTSGGALVAQYLNLPAALEPIPSWVRDTALPGI